MDLLSSGQASPVVNTQGDFDGIDNCSIRTEDFSRQFKVTIAKDMEDSAFDEVGILSARRSITDLNSLTQKGRMSPCLSQDFNVPEPWSQYRPRASPRPFAQSFTNKYAQYSWSRRTIPSPTDLPNNSSLRVSSTREAEKSYLHKDTDSEPWPKQQYASPCSDKQSSYPPPERIDRSYSPYQHRLPLKSVRATVCKTANTISRNKDSLAHDSYDESTLRYKSWPTEPSKYQLWSKRESTEDRIRQPSVLPASPSSVLWKPESRKTTHTGMQRSLREAGNGKETRSLEAKTQAAHTMTCSSWKNQSTDTLSDRLKGCFASHDAAQQTDDAASQTVQTSPPSGEKNLVIGSRTCETLGLEMGKFSGPFGKRSPSLASVSTLTTELQPDTARSNQKEVHGSVTDINGICNFLRSTKEDERVLRLEQKLCEAQYELESQHVINQKVVRKLEHDLKQRNTNLVWLQNEHQQLIKELEASRQENSRVLSEQTSKRNVLEEQLEETKRDLNAQLLVSERLLRSTRRNHQEEMKTIEAELQILCQSKEKTRRENEVLKQKITEEHAALIAARYAVAELEQARVGLQKKLRDQMAESQYDIQLLRTKITAHLPGEPKQVTTACRAFDELKSWYASEMQELKETIQKQLREGGGTADQSRPDFDEALSHLPRSADDASRCNQNLPERPYNWDRLKWLEDARHDCPPEFRDKTVSVYQNLSTEKSTWVSTAKPDAYLQQKLEAVEEELEVIRRSSESSMDNLRKVHTDELTAAQDVNKVAQSEGRRVFF